MIDKLPRSASVVLPSPSLTQSSTRRTPVTTLTLAPRPRRLRQEHDHRCCSDGRRDPRYRCRRPDGSDSSSPCSLVRLVFPRCLPQQVRHDEELIELVEMEVRELLEGHHYIPRRRHRSSAVPLSRPSRVTKSGRRRSGSTRLAPYIPNPETPDAPIPDGC